MKKMVALGLGRISEIQWLFIITIVGILLKFVVMYFFKWVPAGGDEAAYIEMALNLVSGNGIIDSMGNYAMYNVGYPLFILAPVFAFLGESIFSVRVLNILLGGITILLCYIVAKEAGANKIGRLLAPALWALYLPASVYAVYLLKENLMTPLMLGVIWCALRMAKEPSRNIALVCGILLGLLALTGNAALSLIAAVAFALIVMPANSIQKLVFSILILISAGLVAMPWVIRNMQVLGAPVLNTNGGFNLYLGNNPAATGMFVSIADTPYAQTWNKLREEQGELIASNILKEEAIKWIKEHPLTFLSLAFKKAAYFWLPPFHEGKGQPSKAETVARVIWAIQFIVLIGAAIGCLFIARLRNRETTLLWLAIMGYTAVHMLFYVIFRYREPIMPLVCVLAALTFESLVHYWQLQRIGANK